MAWPAAERELEHARVAAEAANAARSAELRPRTSRLYVSRRARAEIAEAHESIELELLGREGSAARRMGAFASVAQGTYAEPR